MYYYCYCCMLQLEVIYLSLSEIRVTGKISTALFCCCEWNCIRGCDSPLLALPRPHTLGERFGGHDVPAEGLLGVHEGFGS